MDAEMSKGCAQDFGKEGSNSQDFRIPNKKVLSFWGRGSPALQMVEITKKHPSIKMVEISRKGVLTPWTPFMHPNFMVIAFPQN